MTKLSTEFIVARYEISTFEKPLPAPYFRKTFELDFTPENAEITICGLGFYELYINGENITKGHLAPYISNPDDVCYYDKYNIAAVLKKGKNAIGIHLGNGFRNPFGGYVWGFDKASCIGPECVSLHLMAKLGDEKLELEADESFLTHPSPVIFNEYRMGYQYDARLEIPGWCDVNFDDCMWSNAISFVAPRGIKKLCSAEPVIVIREVKAKSVKHYDTLALAYDKIDFDAAPIDGATRENVYVYDFGENTAGVTKLKISGRKGQKIIVRHGDYCFDGKHFLNSVTLHNTAQMSKYFDYFQTDIFICKGGEETFIPKFKYDGFRYAYVEGLSYGQLNTDTLTLLEVRSDVKPRASFACSNDRINKLYQMTRQSDLSNLHYVITDCPHREKNGWTGDVSLSAEHMLLNLTVENTMREWLLGVRCAQNNEGAIPGIVPTGGWGFDWSRGPVWDSVCLNVPYYIYKYTGNKEVILENSSMIIRSIKYLYSTRNKKGLVEFGLGDWKDPRWVTTRVFTSPKVFTNSIILYDMAAKAQKLFTEAGLINEAFYVGKIAKEMRANIRRELIDYDTMTALGNCQTSQAMAIAIGIFEENELAEACKKLVEIIHADGDVSICGVLGMRYLFHALVTADEADLAYKLITSTEETCYGSWVEQGETTLRESFTYPATDSHNHHMFGDISSFFIQFFAGLKPNPGIDDIYNFEFSPQFISDLTFAKADYKNDLGTVSCGWERSVDDIILYITLPKGVKGSIKLPQGYIMKNNVKLSEGENKYRILGK